MQYFYYATNFLEYIIHIAKYKFTKILLSYLETAHPPLNRYTNTLAFIWKFVNKKKVAGE